MANVLIHRADQLKPETRAAIEAELGRSLADDEDVSIMAFSQHDSPTGAAREAARQKLQTHLNRIDRQKPLASDQEAEEALDDALRNIRTGYRERE